MNSHKFRRRSNGLSQESLGKFECVVTLLPEGDKPGVADCDGDKALFHLEKAFVFNQVDQSGWFGSRDRPSLRVGDRIMAEVFRSGNGFVIDRWGLIVDTAGQRTGGTDTLQEIVDLAEADGKIEVRSPLSQRGNNVLAFPIQGSSSGIPRPGGRVDRRRFSQIRSGDGKVGTG